jgi:hypothetical protein
MAYHGQVLHQHPYRLAHLKDMIHVLTVGHQMVLLCILMVTDIVLYVTNLNVVTALLLIVHNRI